MDDLSLPFNFRINELLPLARLLRASYQRDRADFVDLLPDDYKPTFLADYDTAVENVEAATRSSVAIAQRGTITARIDALLEALPQLLNRLEARLRRAENLTVAAKKFGIEPVRRDRNNHEHEGLADSLKTLLQNINANKAALLAKGQTQAEIDQLQELYDGLVADSTAQGSSLSDQRLHTAANVQLFRALYKPMKQLMDDGKSLYKTADKVKLQDYTLRKILQQVRREQKEKGKEGE
jgi:CRISPR/Cas system CSM-associated protein Csm2 small subunit